MHALGFFWYSFVLQWPLPSRQFESHGCLAACRSVSPAAVAAVSAAAPAACLLLLLLLLRLLRGEPIKVTRWTLASKFFPFFFRGSGGNITSCGGNITSFPRHTLAGGTRADAR